MLSRVLGLLVVVAAARRSLLQQNVQLQAGFPVLQKLVSSVLLGKSSHADLAPPIQLLVTAVQRHPTQATGILAAHFKDPEFLDALADLEADGDLLGEYQWWMQSMKKEDPDLSRFGQWLANYMTVEMHNNGVHLADPNQGSVKLACNQFCDISKEEFMALNSCSGDRSNDWTKLGFHLPEEDEELPASVDWRKKGAVTPVKNQGQCGSCWTFSTTGALEGAKAVKTGTLTSLSEQEFVDCDKGGFGCGGGLMGQAFEWAETQNICTEASYPYTAEDGTCKKKCTDIGIKQGEVIGFTRVPEGDMEAMMSAVAQQPVSVAIEADQSIFQLYNGGVLSNKKGDSCGTMLDHGVLAVGYGYDQSLDKKYWIVKNSWGEDWGEEGYIRLERGIGGDGECGILKQASYPQFKASEQME